VRKLLLPIPVSGCGRRRWQGLWALDGLRYIHRLYPASKFGKTIWEFLKLKGQLIGIEQKAALGLIKINHSIALPENVPLSVEIII
jgi:hypothetical protein